jgi:preprotein translocase subunit YajC
VVFAGIIGAGLVWGWLLVLFVDQRPQRTRTQPEAETEDNSSKPIQYLKAFLTKWQTERRPYLNLLAVTIFTIWFAWLIYAFTNTTQLIFFFVAVIIAFLIHFAWRQQLRQAQKNS